MSLLIVRKIWVFFFTFAKYVLVLLFCFMFAAHVDSVIWSPYEFLQNNDFDFPKPTMYLDVNNNKKSK